MAFQMNSEEVAMAFHRICKEVSTIFKIALVSKVEVDIVKGIACLSTILSFRSDKVFVKLFATDDTTLWEVHCEIHDQIDLVYPSRLYPVYNFQGFFDDLSISSLLKS